MALLFLMQLRKECHRACENPVGGPCWDCDYSEPSFLSLPRSSSGTGTSSRGSLGVAFRGGGGPEESLSLCPVTNSISFLVFGSLAHALLDGVDDRRIEQGGHVAEVAMLGHITEQPAHDLAASGLG